ncbi:hypothetical protein SLE2022_405620 [Rubroshorea leprosula]
MSASCAAGGCGGTRPRTSSRPADAGAGAGRAAALPRRGAARLDGGARDRDRRVEPAVAHAAPARAVAGWLMESWPAILTAPLRDVRAAARAVSRARALATPASGRGPGGAGTVGGEAFDPPTGPLRVGVALDADRPRLIAIAAVRPTGELIAARATGIVHAATTAGDPAVVAKALPRWSGSAWAFVRGGGRARPLAGESQIGGGQAGGRALYRLDDRGTLAASARLSRTIGGPRQAEAAAGIDWRPLPAVPLHLTVERRIAIDRGGRDAFAAGAAGGVYDVKPAAGWRLDGYGEAGVVGLRRRDLYVDGAVRGGREVALGGPLGDGATLTLGAGVFGAAQPHASRLDAGPSAVARLPVAAHTVAVALDYRARLAGDARPGSGVALTVGIDF